MIIIKNLKKYYGEVKAVNGISLEIKKGEMFGLVGPDGAGKTTTIRVLCGLLPFESGEIEILGKDLIKFRKKIQNKIGYLSQKFSLYNDLTVDENIEFFAEIHNVKDYKNRRDELLQFTRLTKFRSRLTENLSGGNVLAHVAGGFSGYFLGVIFFKQEKEDAKHELAVEIDYMQSKRNTFSSIAGTFKGDSLYLDNKLREDEAKKAYGKYVESLYRLVKAGKTAEAIVHILEKYDLYEKSPELYEELFHEVGEWKKKRVYLCLGRLLIHLYLEQKKPGKIPAVVKACLSVDDDFGLAEPANLLFVVNAFIAMHQFELAYELVKNAKFKYGEYINRCDCLLLEARILWEHLDRETEAKSLLEQGMVAASQNEKDKMLNLLNLMKGS